MKVSLIISTYNRPDALRLCVMSALDQSVLPDEIVIADDGSGESTKALIDELKTLSATPIVHVWHEDKGFRLAAIRNKAISTTKYDYLIQVDGDIILHRHFIKDHIEQAEPGYFMRGGRVRLNKEVTQSKIDKQEHIIKISDWIRDFYFNALRCKALRYYLAKRYSKQVDHIHGCNMAFWRSDLTKVNGYNEDIEGWGHEDVELALRLYNSGVMPKSLKFGGVAYHLFHPTNSKDNAAKNAELRDKVKTLKSVWCDNGIKKQL